MGVTPGLPSGTLRGMAQNYSNHRKFVPLYHVALFLMLVLTFIGSCVNVWKSAGNHEVLYSASLILVLTLSCILLYFFGRVFPLKAQDRAIRAEENLRHFALTGKLLDPRLTLRQVIGLRFAPDAEFVELAKRAAEEGLSEDDIKKSIKNWKADDYRV
jgi:hypothetical protein